MCAEGMLCAEAQASKSPCTVYHNTQDTESNVSQEIRDAYMYKLERTTFAFDSITSSQK